jgi:hypothetical protein
MGALSSLNLAKNMLRAEGAKQLSSAIKGHKALTILDISSNEIGAYARDNDGRAPWIASPEGPIALADAIKNNGALSKLDLSMNRIPATGMADMLNATCKANGVDLAM